MGQEFPSSKYSKEHIIRNARKWFEDVVTKFVLNKENLRVTEDLLINKWQKHERDKRENLITIMGKSSMLLLRPKQLSAFTIETS